MALLLGACMQDEPPVADSQPATTPPPAAAPTAAPKLADPPPGFIRLATSSPGAAGDASFSGTVTELFMSDHPLDEDDEPHAPELSPRAVALGQDWSEPRELQHDGLTTWTWQGQDGLWELRVRGEPTLSDDDTRLEWAGLDDGFRLVVPDPAGETVFAASCMSDGRPPVLSGTLHGRPASPDELAAELAGLLPTVAAYTGVVADHRIEVAVMNGGVRAGLHEISHLTSGPAKLEGYRTLLREADEPSHGDLAALLRQAAHDVPGDGAMRELLGSVADLSFDDRAIAGPLLAAAATIEDDDLLGELLRELLERSDEISPATLAQVLRTAATSIERDAPLSAVLAEAAWHAMGSPAARDAWNEALATIEADAPHATAVESVLSIGDAPADECLIAVRSAAQHIQTEELRAQALVSIDLDELADPRVAEAYSEALAGFEDVNVLSDLLVNLLKRPEGTAAFSARWLVAAKGLSRDGRLGSVLRAVPTRHLSDPAVKAQYLPLAASLWTTEDRDELLARPPVDPPAAQPH